MPSENSVYRRLASGDRKTWLANDHLLRIRAGLFRENYSRLYWADLRAAILYRMEPPATALLLAEAFSLALAVAGAVLVNMVWGAVAGVLFAAVYTVWRLTRPRWAVQLFTKVSSIRFPLLSSLESSRRLLDELKSRILAAQEKLPPVDMALTAIGPQVISVSAIAKDEGGRRRPRVILYGLLFGFGAVSGLAKATVALYCFVFLMMSFVPRDFDFPPSIRSAIVLNEIVAVLRIVTWFASFRYPSLFLSGQRLQFNHEFTLASIVFSLFGLMAVAIRSRQSSGYTVKSSTVLGLGNPAA